MAMKLNANGNTQPASDIAEKCGRDKVELSLSTAVRLWAGTMCRVGQVLACMWCGTHLWELSELWHSLGELNEVLDLEHATVLLVRHFAEETRQVLRLVLRRVPHRVCVRC